MRYERWFASQYLNKGNFSPLPFFISHSIAYAAEIEHFTLIQRPIEDTTDRSRLSMILEDFLW